MNKMKQKSFAAFIILCLFLSIFNSITPNYVNAIGADQTISGTLFRPAGYTTSGAIDVNIIAEVSNQPNMIVSSITIPDGSPSISYSITVPDNQSYKLYYDIQSGSGVLRHGFRKTAYYKQNSSAVSNPDEATAVMVQSAEVSGLDLTLVPAKLISGTISLPDGQVAPQGGYNITLHAMNQSTWVNGDTTILEGQNSASYNIIVEDALGITSFKVAYGFNYGTIQGYFNWGNYANGVTAPQDKLASDISIAQGDVSGINLTLIPCKTISGVIALPQGQVAPQSGLQVNVDARDDNGTQDQNDDIDLNNNCITIPSNSNSVAFSIDVLDSHTYKLFFQPQQGSGYVSPQFYKSTGIVLSYASAENVVVNGSNIAVSDAQNPTVLTKSLTISGNISLPNGQTAPQGGLQVQVGAFNNQEGLYYGTSATIAENNSTVPFFIDVQDGKTYSLRAEPNAGNGYVSPVYFKNGGSVLSNNETEAINVNGLSIENNNIQLIPGKIVSGTISRESGTGQFDISIFVQKMDNYGKWQMSSEQHFTFAEGETSKAFTLTVPMGSDLKLGYHLMNQNGFSGYLNDGYYSANGTKANNNDADTFNISNDITGLVFNIAKASTITGTVTLPVGETASEDINVNINAWLDNGTPDNKQDDISAYSNVNIPTGQISAQFNISIPDGINSNAIIRAMTDAQCQYTGSPEISLPIQAGKYNGSEIKLELSKLQLKGTVYEPGTSSTPVPWTYINIKVKDSQNGVPGVSTDDQGNFSIGGLGDGTYILTAMGGNYTNSQDIEITVTNKAISATSVALDNGTLKIHLTSPQINGVVKTKDGGNAKGGYIDVFTLSTDPKKGNIFLSGSNINEDGSFLIGGLNPGTYTLRANPSSEDMKNGNTSKDTQVIINEVGQLVDGQGQVIDPPNIQIQFSAPQIIGGLIDPNGQVVLNAYVDLMQDTGSYREWIKGSPVMDGNFAFSGLNDGVYIIKAHPSQNSMFCESQDVVIKIDQNQFAGVMNSDGSFSVPQDKLMLSLRNVQVNGIVKNPDGTTARWGYVDVRPANNEDKYQQNGASFDENGNFKIAGLAPGTYIFTANPDWSTGYTPSAGVTVTIDQDGNYTGNTLALNLRSAQLSGTVVNPQGSPEPYGWLEVRYQQAGTDKDKNEYCFGVPVDQDGNFSLGGLSQGNYILKAHPNDGSQLSSSGEVTITIDANGEYTGGNLTIELENPSITGYILKPDNSAAQYGWINVETFDGKWIDGTGADVNGYFKLGTLAAGTYKIKAYPDWMSNYSESDSQTIIVDSQGNVSGFSGTLKLKNPQVIGTVMGPVGSADQNNALPYGWVELRKQDGQGGYDWFGGSGVNENGQFRIAGLNDGIYTVIVHPDWESNYSPSTETIIHIVDGTCTEGQLTLHMTNVQISGAVKGPVGSNDANNSIPYGYVELRKQNGQNWDWINGLPVDELGKFKVGGLEDGTYSLKVYPDWNSQYSSSSSYQFTIAGGICDSGFGDPSNATVNLVNQQLTGNIKDYTGQNVQYGSVEIRKQNGSNYDWLNNIEIDENGTFKLGGLTDGSYKIMAYPKYGNKISPSGYITLTIEGDAVTSAVGSGVSLNAGDKTLTIILGAPQIFGTVIDPSGNAIPYCWVEVRDAQDNFVIGTGTDEQGKYTLSGLVDGGYKIKAYPSNDADLAQSANVSITVTNGSYPQNPLTISLRAAAAVGTVKNQGNTIKKGWVEIYDNNGSWVMTLPVDETGHFKLGGLNSGSYTIQAYQIANSGFESSAKKALVIGNDSSVTYDGTVIDQANPFVINIVAANITGTVYKNDGVTTVDNGWVEIGDSNSVWLLNVPIAPDGTFKLPDLAAGSYKIQAFNKNYSPSAEQTLIVDGQGKVLTLQLN